MIIQVYSHPHTTNPHALIGEIIISGGVVVNIHPNPERTHWTNVKVGMKMKDAVRFVRNHSGYGTYVRIEYPPDDVPEQSDDLKKSEKETPAGGPVYDLGNGYELKYLKGQQAHEYDQDRWKDAWVIGQRGSDKMAGMIDITHAPEQFGTFVAESQVMPEHRGKGLGRLSYKILANHYGDLSSDELWTSSEAQKAWKSLKAQALELKNAMGQNRMSITGESPITWENESLKKADAPPPEPSYYESKMPKQTLKELGAIAGIESSGGKFREHELQNSGIHKGTFAYSSYGLMPVSIKELADKNKGFSSTTLGRKISALHPIDNMDEIHKITEDPNNDTEIASHMWKYIQSRVSKFAPADHVSDLSAYAWRKGITAAKNAYLEGGIDTIRQHGYVQKFNQNLTSPAPKSKKTPSYSPPSEASDKFMQTLSDPANKRESISRMHIVLGRPNALVIIPQEIKKPIAEYLGNLGYPKDKHDEETIPHMFEIINNPVTRKTFMNVNRDKFPTDSDKQMFLNSLSNAWKNLKIDNMKKSEPLEKTRGRLEFPSIMPTRQDQQVASVGNERQARIEAIKTEGGGLYRDPIHEDIMRSIDKQKLHNVLKALNEKAGSSSAPTAMYDSGATSGGEGYKPTAYTLSGAPEYTKEHEAIHMTLFGIGHKYGNQAQENITNELNKMIHPHVKKMLKKQIESFNYAPSEIANEYVTYLHDLLHDSNRRSNFQRVNGLSDLAMNHYMGHAKKSWDAIRAFGKSYKPGERK